MVGQFFPEKVFKSREFPFKILQPYPKKLLIIKAFVFQNPSSSSISLSITSVKMMDIFMLPFQDQVIASIISLRPSLNSFIYSMCTVD